MKIDDIKTRIRKLMALANDGGASEGETENALRFAQKLMDEHHLSQSDVAPEDVKFCQSDTYCGSNLSPWETSLAWAIVKTVGSIGWYTKGRRPTPPGHKHAQRTSRGGPKSVTVVTFYGPINDVALALEIWDTMRVTITSLAYAKYGNAFKGDGRSYCMGFANTLYRMAKEHENVGRTEQVQGLVLRKSALAKTWLQGQIGGRLRSGKSSASGARDGEAYANGQRDGSNSSLSGIRRKVGKQFRLTA